MSEIDRMLERERALTARLERLRLLIGATIRRERERKKMPLFRLAERAALPGSEVSLLERGRVWKPEKMARLARALRERAPRDDPPQPNASAA